MEIRIKGANEYSIAFLGYIVSLVHFYWNDLVTMKVDERLPLFSKYLTEYNIDVDAYRTPACLIVDIKNV